VLVADLAQAFPVAGRRDNRTAGILDRLHDDHRDRLGLFERDRCLDLVEKDPRELGFVAASGRMPVGVGR
jgi:hypothetical protein